MTKLLETIKCLDGQAFHLDYHRQRMNTALQVLGKPPIKHDIKLDPPSQGLYRCRIVYEETIESIEYIPYRPKIPQRFKLIHSQIDYALKYADRGEIDALVAQKEDADEIIIVKDGLITDTSIANICVYDGRQWLTPAKALLAGTTRQRLLDAKQIMETDIAYEKLVNYEKIAIMNAMLGFVEIEDAIII